MQDVGHLELIWLTVKRTSRVGRSLQNEQMIIGKFSDFSDFFCRWQEDSDPK